jgi:hypothetical protein
MESAECNSSFEADLTIASLGLFFYFRVESSETNSTVQEQPGIFQLIDQLETAVDKILERQVF